MAIKTLKICFVFFILIPSFFSCTPQKNYIYLQDKGNNSGTVSDKNISFVYKIKPKDVLYIKTVPIDEESSLSLNANTQTNAYSTELGAYLNSLV